MGETAAVLEQAKQPEQHDESLDLFPYGYPEFSGPGGARYLKKVLICMEKVLEATTVHSLGRRYCPDLQRCMEILASCCKAY